MSKQHPPAPVPPANRPQAGPHQPNPAEMPAEGTEGFQEQDPKRRLGGYETAGEHSIQQPSALNDGTTHSQ